MEETEQNDFPNPGTGRPAVSRVTSDFWAMVSHYEKFICEISHSTFNFTAWCHKQFFSRAEGLLSATHHSAGWQEDNRKRVSKACVLTGRFMP